MRTADILIHLKLSLNCIFVARNLVRACMFFDVKIRYLHASQMWSTCFAHDTDPTKITQFANESVLKQWALKVNL